MVNYSVRSIIVVSAVLAVAADTRGDVNTYANQADFLAVADAPSLESFESFTATNTRNLSNLVTTNFTLTANSNFGVFDEQPDFFGTFATHGSQYIVSGANSSSMTFTFDQPIAAFGLNITDFGDNANDGDLILTIGGESFAIASAPLSNGNQLFFGVVKTASTFSSATLTIEQDSIGIDEVYTATANSSPIARATIFVDGVDAGDFVELPCEDLPEYGHGAIVTLDGSGSSDPDGDDLEGEWSVAEGSGILIEDATAALTDAVFPVGVHEATLTVYDLGENGDRKGTLDMTSVTVIVFDNAPPIVMVSTDLGALWPANNKMVPVIIVVEASDACSDPGSLHVVCEITSSQPDDSDGTAELVGDVDGEDGFAQPVPISLDFFEFEGVYAALVYLRAERDGEDKAGRVYSINVGVLDAEENFGQASTTVVVPHDGRKK